MMKILFYCLLVFLISSCQTKNGSEEKKTIEQNSYVFQLPEIPPDFTDSNDRLSYLAVHYWDLYDFKDTLIIENKDVTEQAVVDYINVLNQVPIQVVKKSIEDFLSKLEEISTVKSYYIAILDNYLYNPNSPMRDELKYEIVLEYLIKSVKTEPIQKQKYSIILTLLKKNKAGEKALNFSYTTSSGAKQSLFDIKTEYTFLFFYEPGCSSCKSSIDEMKDNDLLNDLIKKNKLSLLAVYTLNEGNVWEEYQSSIPSNWINADNGNEIRNGQMYDLKASPTMYLLDKDKKVLLKDTYLIEILILLNRKIDY